MRISAFEPFHQRIKNPVDHRGPLSLQGDVPWSAIFQGSQSGKCLHCPFRFPHVSPHRTAGILSDAKAQQAQLCTHVVVWPLLFASCLKLSCRLTCLLACPNSLYWSCDNMVSSLAAQPWQTNWLLIDLISFDFSKASDSINRFLILVKSWGYGISLTVISWVESFPSWRTVQMNVNWVLSEIADTINHDPSTVSIIGTFLSGI